MTESSPLRVVIADDEPLARRRLRAMLESAGGVEVIGECESAEETLDATAAAKPDVVFLDIQMPGLTGIEVAGQLEAHGDPAVVFVTAHAEHALEAFELAATDYLLKPFSKGRLEATLERLRDRAASKTSSNLAALIDTLSGGRRYPDRIPIPGRSRVVFVDVAQIERVEADGNYVVIHVGEKTHLLRSYLSDMEKRLDPSRFIRIHRSHLVRRDLITELRTSASGGHTAVLASGAQLPVGRTYSQSLLDV